MRVTRNASQDCLCPKYLDLLAENARLKEDIARLKAKLSRQERTAKEQPFGLSTPSSQRLVKPSAPERTPAEVQRRKGGAPVGHTGCGWKPPEGPEPAVEVLPAVEACPCCGGPLVDFPGEDACIRDLIDCNPCRPSGGVCGCRRAIARIAANPCVPASPACCPRPV